MKIQLMCHPKDPDKADAVIIPGTLPEITVSAENLPIGWEMAVLATWKYGAKIATQYDQPGDPPSRDAIAVIVVRDPFAEPRIHRAFPGGITELEMYRQEVVDGIHDHWIDPDDQSGRWTHTYHDRLTNYPFFRWVEACAKSFLEWIPEHFQKERLNQIDAVIDALVKAPHTRRALAITRIPGEDFQTGEPSCLQYLWFRIFEGTRGEELIADIHIRSNDAFKAAFMNMYAFSDLQRVVAEQVSKRLGRPIRVGQYTHIADSFHIYGSYFGEFEGFLTSLEKRTFEERTWRTVYVQPLIDEARVQITRSLEEERRTGRKGL